MTGRAFTIQPRGDFSLREAALFGFGQRDRPAPARPGEPEWDGVLRMAFCLDGGFEHQAGVELRQEAPGAAVHGVAHGVGAGAAQLPAVVAQTARVLSLDHDARDYAEVGRRDPVVRRLQLAAPGLRPPLFHSPYEAAAWAVLSARRPGAQMARVRTALSTAAGRRFTLAGGPVAALPTPSRLLRLAAFPGIDTERLERLHGVARAAADGLLEASRLRALGPEEAHADVQRLRGVGPLFATLITVRGVGFADALPAAEPRLQALVGTLWGLGDTATPDQLRGIAEAWRPWRTWVSVLVRAAGPRVLVTRGERLSA